MCGIAGIHNFSGPLQAEQLHELDLLVSRIRNRGPDHQDVKRCGFMTALGGARLRITDSENKAADLPMTSICGRYTAVLNGEIYNHLPLRNALPAENFRTRSDTETLIEAFRKWGPDCVTKFEGMFAYALHDNITNTLHIARDPAGQKPFYYLNDGAAFAFSSDIKALIADPYRRKTLAADAISEFVSCCMIRGSDTQYKEIKKLPGGHRMSVSASGDMAIQKYYTIPVSEQRITDEQEAIDLIRQRIDASVKETAQIEHPAALLLSGGIDSTGVLALLQKHGVQPKTYAIGFGLFAGDTFGLPSTFNEFEHSRLAARHFGSNHTEISLTPKDYISSISAWSKMMGEPLDATEAPMLHTLFSRIANDGLRLAFCGSGPDEVFDGYGLGPRLADTNFETISAAYLDRFSWTYETSLSRLMPEHYQQARASAIAKTEAMLAPYKGVTQSPAQLAQFINVHGRLQNYEFAEMDMTSASHAVETRSPLIAGPVIEAAFSFDPALKRRNDVAKWVYKESWRGILPDSIIDRPKSGFETPIEFWFSDAYESAIEDSVFDPASPVLTCGVFDTSYLRACWDNRSPAHRAVFYRLHCLALMMAEQSSLQSSSQDSYRISA